MRTKIDEIQRCILSLLHSPYGGTVTVDVPPGENSDHNCIKYKVTVCNLKSDELNIDQHKRHGQ